MRRSVPALIALAVVAGATLAGCSTSSDASPACTVHSGSGSDSVSATGKFGQDPEAKVPSPLNVAQTQSTTLITGTGAPVREGGVARLSVTIFDGTTGESQPTQSGYFAVTGSQISTGLTNALSCAREGSRIAVVIPQKDGASTFGVQGSIVVIADVEQALPNRATGRPRPATPGFPTVVLAPSGQPGIVIGSHPEPTKVSSAVLRQGDGATTKKADTIVVQTQTVSWSDPTTATGSWEQKEPATQTLSDGSALSGALIGKKVGSQVIVLVPKAKSADGQSEATVVDILGVLPAAATSGAQ